MKELKLDHNNPSPFKQPFLVLHFKGDSSATEWLVDVDGKIDLYIKDYTHIKQLWKNLDDNDPRKGGFIVAWNWQSQATPFFQEIIAELVKFDAIVNRVHIYEGSAGPSHILRNGAFFRRVDMEQHPFKPKKRVPFDKWPDVAKYLPKLLGEDAAAVRVS